MDAFPLLDLPDAPPALVPAPAKRARPCARGPLSTPEDPEESLNRHDQHITAVLTKIIVRRSRLSGPMYPGPLGCRVGLAGTLGLGWGSTERVTQVGFDLSEIRLEA